MTIVLDAGHGGVDPGVTFRDREEKQDVLKLTLTIGRILDGKGYPVLYTRTDDRYYTPYQKVMMANESNADVFLSIHRNATPNGQEADGVMSFVQSDAGLQKEMARRMNQNLEKLGFLNLGVRERPDLILLRRTNIPSIIEEVGFLNSEKDNQIFDEKMDLIAQAIAEGVVDTLQQKGKTLELYHVQVGAFRNRFYAERLLESLVKERFPAFLKYQNGYYIVQVGVFPDREHAIEMEQVLRRIGYDSCITTI